jgi:hypothetical protein
MLKQWLYLTLFNDADSSIRHEKSGNNVTNVYCIKIWEKEFVIYYKAAC